MEAEHRLVTDWGISQTTLEDVYMEIGRQFHDAEPAHPPLTGLDGVDWGVRPWPLSSGRGVQTTPGSQSWSTLNLMDGIQSLVCTTHQCPFAAVHRTKKGGQPGQIISLPPSKCNVKSDLDRATTVGLKRLKPAQGTAPPEPYFGFLHPPSASCCAKK